MNYYTSVLKKYAVFSGRATRREFWMYTLWNTIVMIAIMVIESILARATGIGAFTILIVIYALGVLLPSLGVSLRRLHDAGFSGWWILLDLIPFGAIVLIIMFVQPSKTDVSSGGPAAAPSVPAV